MARSRYGKELSKCEQQSEILSWASRCSHAYTYCTIVMSFSRYTTNKHYAHDPSSFENKSYYLESSPMASTNSPELCGPKELPLQVICRMARQC